MKILLIVGVILCITLPSTAQSSDELALESSHDPSGYQKEAIANKTEFNAEISHQSLEYQKEVTTATENSHQLLESQKSTVTNKTESQDHFLSLIRFWPNFFPFIVKKRRWIPSYSFGNGLENNLSGKVTTEQDYSKIQAITVSATEINTELATETSQAPSEYQKGTVTNESELATETSYQTSQERTVSSKSEPHHFSLRFLLHSISNIFSPRHWIYSHSLKNGVENNTNDKASTDHGNSEVEDNKVASVDSVSTPHVLHNRSGRLQRSDSSKYQAEGHPRISPFLFWLHSTPQDLSKHVEEISNLRENGTTQTITAERGAEKVNPPHMLHVRLEKLQRSKPHISPFYLWVLAQPLLHRNQPVMGLPSWNKNKTTIRTQTITGKTGSYGILIIMKKKFHRHFNQFSHFKRLSWMSLFCFIFKVMIYGLAITGLFLLVHNIFSTKKNTEPIVKKKAKNAAYYMIV